MQKEVITQKHAVSMMILFIIGSTMVLGVGAEAKQDVWISIPLAMLIATPMLFVYARIVKLFPGNSLYDILEILYGKIFGKIISVLFIWYSLHLGSLVIRNITEFIQIVSIPETPQFILVISVGLLNIYFIKLGIEVVGRWARIIFIFSIISIFILFALSTTQIHPENIKPVLYNGLQPIIKSATTVFSFPMAETVVFLSFLGALREKDSPYKVYYKGMLIAGITITIAAVRNVMVLGVELASTLYFPSYSSVSLINISNFLQRAEIMITIIFLLSGFIKICVCLFSTCIGIAKLFNFKDYRDIVIPTALIMINITYIIYGSAMEMFDWATKIYKFYAFPFQVILPIIILITAEIKTRTMKNKSTA